MAQVVEIHTELEKIKVEAAGWNRSLNMLHREQEALREMSVPQISRKPNERRQRKGPGMYQIAEPSDSVSY